MELTKEHFDRHMKQVVTKDYLDNKQMVTQDYLDDRLANTVTQDYLDNKLLEFPTKSEFKSLQSTVEDIAQELHELNSRDKEDSDALAKNYLNHERRIVRLEQKVKIRVVDGPDLDKPSILE